MNTARRIIASIFVPILVGIPILSFEVKKNYIQTEAGSSWTPAPLYGSPMAWWAVVLGTAIFLMILWREPSQESADQTGGEERSDS